MLSVKDRSRKNIFHQDPNLKQNCLEFNPPCADSLEVAPLVISMLNVSACWWAEFVCTCMSLCMCSPSGTVADC